MENKPLISLCIPTNGVIYLFAPVLESIYKQQCDENKFEVIVTDNGGQREYVVQEQNGMLVPPGDAKALAEAIARMVDDGALRQRLGQQAKIDFDDHLNYAHFYAQIKTVYEA